MNKPIPLIDVKAQNEPLKKEILAAFERLIDASSFILGNEVAALEDEVKAYTGISHSIACASGTDALLLPLMEMGIGPGDEVLVPSFTFYATAGSVARLGGTPVFVDSDETYNICLKDLERKISKKTKCIIPVHLFGQMADMEAINALAKGASTPGASIKVLEDCAQSLGAALHGKQAGTWGDYGAYSFYPTKNLGAMGDAGLMSARDAATAERLKMIRVHGSKQRYYHEIIGVNSRLDSLQAAALRIKLRKLPEYEKGRESLAMAYMAAFSAQNLAEEVKLPVVGKNRKHVWNQYTIRAKKRDALKAFLQEQGIGSEIYYPLPMHKQKSFLLGQTPVNLSMCDALEQEVLSLPMYPEMPMESVERVVDSIAKFYSK
jgi:dTDP-4-amino-4,6-dideoxygalactose transaminase